MHTFPSFVYVANNKRRTTRVMSRMLLRYRKSRVSSAVFDGVLSDNGPNQTTADNGKIIFVVDRNVNA